MIRLHATIECDRCNATEAFAVSVRYVEPRCSSPALLPIDSIDLPAGWMNRYGEHEVYWCPACALRGESAIGKLARRVAVSEEG